MKQTTLYLILTSVLLTGCATTRGPSDVTQLQIKVNQLEKKLDEAGQEIEELKFAVNNLGAQSDDSNNVSFNDPIEDLSAAGAARQSSTLSSAGGEGIIRVNESPQQIQTALKTAGYYHGNIDGKIGGGSQQAIRDFQRDHNLTADGVVGKATWAELKNYLQ